MLIIASMPNRCLYFWSNTCKSTQWIDTGTVNRGQWMPFILYPAKMFDFNAQVEYGKDMVGKLEKIYKFNELF